MSVRLLATVLACGFLLASADRAMAEDKPAKDAVTKINEQFDAALSRRDISALDAAWAHDDSVTAIHPSSKAVVTGWDAVRKSWQGAFDAFPELSVTLKDASVRVVGNLASVVGVETIRGRRPNGETAEFAALTTNIYELRNGSWLMVHHQASRSPQ